jgi:ATP adenylyltransferase
MWAPWRLEYIRSLMSKGQTGCFLCRYAEHPEADAAQHIVWRTPTCMTMFNHYPYSNGHLMVAPTTHTANLYDLPEGVIEEMMRATRDAQRLLAATLSPQGFNIGINIGKCAGAGLPDHVHIHIVPRWEGDTNFMSVCSDTRVIPQDLDSLYAQLRESAVRVGLPALRG